MRAMSRSVTEAASSLQAAGLIQYRRGIVTIVDGSGLEAFSCEDYRLTRAGYDRMLESESHVARS